MVFREIAIQAAKSVGAVLKEDFNKVEEIRAKGKHDIVSDSDFRSEQMIIDMIKSRFPDHVIVSEESGRVGGNSEYCWYIDPLDGTSNFVMGNPYFSVSIALAKRRKVILGVVYNPILNELFFAEKCKGSFLNGKTISVSNKSELKDAFIASAYSSDESDIRKGLKVVEILSMKSRKVVINFSPALNLCNVARGRIDALVDNGTTPEDHAAGSLLVMEAGGMVQNYGYSGWDVNRKGIVASNGVLQKPLLSLL